MSNKNQEAPGSAASNSAIDANPSATQRGTGADQSQGPSLEPRLICYCYPTTARQIEFLVQHQGVRSLGEIKALTGAATGCMGCEAEVEALLSSLLKG